MGDGNKFTDATKVEYVSTEHFADAATAVKNVAEAMMTVLETLNVQKDLLLNNWVGQGRNNFEIAYELVYRKLKDQMDLSWELYGDLVDAEAEYIQGDIITQKFFSDSSLTGEN